MTDPTQIPASEVERWEKEALELYPDKEFYDHYDYRSEADYAFREQREQEQAIRDSYIAGAKSEYLRREREVQELKDLLDRAKSHLDVSYDSFQSREDLYNEIKKLLRCTI